MPLLTIPAQVAIPVIAILGFIAVFAIIHERRRQQQRSADMAVVAAKLGFSFSGPPDKQFAALLGAFPLFTRGGTRQSRNIMTGQADDTEVMIFDYAYTVSSGENTDTYSQTVIALRWPASDVPTFSLRPERLLDKLAAKLGWEDINFDSHPEFSRIYQLKGQNQTAVRAAFTDEVITFYESNPGLTTEVAGGLMLFYRDAKDVPPDGIPAFYQAGWTAYALLRNLPAPTAT